MAATTLSAPTHSAEALLNRARRLSSASYEKNYPQPPSPTRFPDGEEPERSSPGMMANSNTPSSPSLSPTTTISASSSSSSPTTATAEGTLITAATTTVITTRRSWSVSSRPRALTLESIKETDLLTIESADETLTLLQARKDLHRKHRSENGQALGFVSDILQVLRQGSDVDLTDTIREGQEDEGKAGSGAPAAGQPRRSCADNSTSKGETTKKDDAGPSSSSSSLVSLTVTLAPCIDADGGDADGDDANNTQQMMPSIHIIHNDNDNDGEDGGQLADVHGQPIQAKNRDQETSDIVMQTLSKAEAEHSREKAGSDNAKQLPALPAEDAKKHHHHTIDATIPATPLSKTVALNATDGVQDSNSASLSASSPANDEHHDQEDEDEQDDVVAPLTSSPASPSSSQRSKELTVADAHSGKSGKLSKKRSSKLFGKLVPKFLQTSFIPSSPAQGVALTPSPQSASSTVTTPASGKSLDYKDTSKTLLLPPIPTVSPGIERDVSLALQQQATDQGETRDNEQRSLLHFGGKTSRRSSQSSVQSRASSKTAPTSSPSIPPSSVSTTTTTTSNSSTIALSFSEENTSKSTTTAAEGATHNHRENENSNSDKGAMDKNEGEDGVSQAKSAKDGDNDDTEFWSSLLRKSCVDAETAVVDTPQVSAITTTTTASSLNSRLAARPSSTSLSSVHSLSSPVCYATDSPSSTDPHWAETDLHYSNSRQKHMSTDSSFKPDDSLSCVGRDERRLRLRDAVAEWRRANSSSQ
ncbi:hypothetical protein DFQ27_000517 [Actinomortierella ambigua]|uniref:Uncharacterized protein n=1 Tax=Actinomortierella ambigua TaxID=1343610 RepID=A0A9P6TW04_9FUNG|nr:hypothetical protein DFQ27_000517 [Actinomortierella ambigua]